MRRSLWHRSTVSLGLGFALIGLWLPLLRPAAAQTEAEQGKDNVSSDTAVLELSLPPGATTMVDGRDYGEQRRLTFQSLDPGQVYHSTLQVKLPGGDRIQRDILFRGGWFVRLPLAATQGRLPELVAQTGHPGTIWSVAFSADRRLVLTCADEAILWDAASGNELRRFSGSPAALSPDGSQLLVGSKDNAPVLLDAASGDRVRVLQGHSDGIRAVAFSPDGRRLVTGSSDYTAIVWDAASGAVVSKLEGVRDLQGNPAAIDSVAISPDGRLVLTSAMNCDHAVLWDLETGKRQRELRLVDGDRAIPNTWVKSAVFSPDGAQIAAAVSFPFGRGRRPVVVLWDVRAGTTLRTFEGHADAITSVAFAPDGRRVVTGSHDKTAILWDAGSGARTRTYQGHDAWLESVAFSRDGRCVLTGSRDRTAVMWDADSGVPLRKFAGHTNPIASVAIIAGNERLFASFRDPQSTHCRAVPILWDAAAGGKPQPVPGVTPPVSRVAISPDGRRVLVGWLKEGKSLCSVLVDTATGARLTKFSELPMFSAAAFGPQGTQMIATGQTPALWDTVGGTKLRSFEMSDAWAVALSPDGRQALVGGSLKTGEEEMPSPIPGLESYRRPTWGPNNSATLWDAASGAKLKTLEGHAGRVVSAAFSPDGRRVLTGSADKSAILWETSTGAKLKTLAGHASWVHSVAFAPDGRQTLTSDGSSIVVWDSDTGGQLRSFSGPPFASAVFTGDGRRVLSGSSDGSLRLWDVATGDELIRLLPLTQGRDWLATTPAGLFEGSAWGRQKVSFRVGGGLNVVSVDRFFQDFYRPGLLAAIWRGERPMPEVEFGKQLPPVVRIISPKSADTVTEGRVTLEVEVTDQGSGIKGPWLMHNGSRVLAAGGSEQKGKVLRRRFTVSLVPGENRFEVKAASSDGSWESEPALLVLRYETPLAKPDLYLVAVGVNRYARQSMNLKFAAADARAMAELFERRGPALYEKVHVTALLDDQGTRSAIRDALTKLSGQARPQDTLVVFLAGHGTMVGQRYYFIPHEFNHGAGAMEDDIRKQGLPADELGDQLAAVPALKRMLILDTCQSGGAVGLAKTGRNPFALRGAIERLSRAQGVFTIAASAAGDEAQEVAELKHGVLTYALLAGLKAAEGGPLEGHTVQPSNPSQVVDVLEWFSFASGQVPRLTQKYFGKEQDVQTSGQGGSFPVLPLVER